MSEPRVCHSSIQQAPPISSINTGIFAIAATRSLLTTTTSSNITVSTSSLNSLYHHRPIMPTPSSPMPLPPPATSTSKNVPYLPTLEELNAPFDSSERPRRLVHPPPFEPDSIVTNSSMTPPGYDYSANYMLQGDSRLRRRGRQATACTECNRRKQKCDGLVPCSHCTKRNVPQECRFPDPSALRSYEDSSRKSKKRKSSNSFEQETPTDFVGLSPQSDKEEEERNRPLESAHNLLAFQGGPQRPLRTSDGQINPQQPAFEYLWAATDHANSIADSIPRKKAHSVDASKSDDELLMEEGGARGIGSLTVEGDDDDELGRQFYGTSHFGPRLAAQITEGAGKVTLGEKEDVMDAQFSHSRRSRFGLFSADTKSSTLAYHIRELAAQLPRRSLCERFVNAYFERYNEQVDLLFEQDFRKKFDIFWTRTLEFEDICSVDLRWLALLLVVIAVGVLLERDPDELPEILRDREELSVKCFMSARRALSEAPSFYGESFDTVRAFALLSLYLIVSRRVHEAWNMIGMGIHAAQAQGMHVDGEVWKLPMKESELRRRIWAQLYILDRSISMFLGRPLTIQDGQFTTRLPSNVTDEELMVKPRPERPLSSPTKTTFLILHYRLAQIIGRIQMTCFGLAPRKHADVMACEFFMIEWQNALPPIFHATKPDTSFDEEFPWLRWQRQSLMSKFHQARISLHRPYLLRPFGRNNAAYNQSAAACVLSAGCELRLRLSLQERETDPFDRFKWMTVASGFAPATILGILLARKQRDDGFDYDEIHTLLREYIEVEKKTSRRDESLEAEIQVLDMMLAQANKNQAEFAASVKKVDQRSSRDDTKPRTWVMVPPQPPASTGSKSNVPQVHVQTDQSTSTAPPMLYPVPASTSQLQQSPALDHSPHTIASQDLLTPVAHPMNMNLGLAPPFFSVPYTDQGEEWLRPLAPGQAAWVPRPPTDPSAGAFPTAENLDAWQGLLDMLEQPAIDGILPWYSSEFQLGSE